jgi:hypothetical protein
VLTSGSTTLLLGVSEDMSSTGACHFFLSFSFLAIRALEMISFKLGGTGVSSSTVMTSGSIALVSEMEAMVALMPFFLMSAMMYASASTFSVLAASIAFNFSATCLVTADAMAFSFSSFSFLQASMLWLGLDLPPPVFALHSRSSSFLSTDNFLYLSGLW